MFTGDRSGDFLFGALHRAGYANQALSCSLDDGLQLSGVWVTAACVAPRREQADSARRSTCASYLSAELQLLQGARASLALGAFA